MKIYMKIITFVLDTFVISFVERRIRITIVIIINPGKIYDFVHKTKLIRFFFSLSLTRKNIMLLINICLPPTFIKFLCEKFLGKCVEWRSFLPNLLSMKFSIQSFPINQKHNYILLYAKSFTGNFIAYKIVGFWRGEFVGCVRLMFLS